MPPVLAVLFPPLAAPPIIKLNVFLRGFCSTPSTTPNSTNTLKLASMVRFLPAPTVAPVERLPVLAAAPRLLNLIAFFARAAGFLLVGVLQLQNLITVLCFLFIMLVKLLYKLFGFIGFYSLTIIKNISRCCSSRNI